MTRSAVVAFAAALLVAGCGGADDAGSAVRGSAGATPPARHFVPTPDHEAAVAARTRPVPRREARWLTARVLRRTTLRATPGGRGIATIGRRTEFGSPRVLAVVSRRGGWLRVSVTERRNGRRAWVRRRAVHLASIDWSIRVDRSARRLALVRDRRVVFRMPVAVGRTGTETPLGRFGVTDKLRPTTAASPYGCCAIALTGHQPRLLPGWPGGDRLAIHATPQSETVGTPASLGCLRGHTRDLERLMRTVPLGTPVFIRR